MKKQTAILISVVLYCFIAMNSCTDDVKTHTTSASEQKENDKTNVKDTVTSQGTDNQTIASIKGRPTNPNSHQCIIPGTVLEDNSFWVKEAQTLIGISADSTTADADFGDSHRILTAMNTADCSILFKETLPVNRSPDFPWYLNTNTYESVNQVLCMQGTEFIFCYDVLAKKILPKMKPKFYNKRIALDAQSGQPAGLSIWDRYLIGFSLDQGASVFDLSNKEKPKAILPAAEFYSENDESYHSLFLLENNKGKIQALIPRLNDDQDGMIANPLFSTPQDINTKVSKNVKDNRFIILSSMDGKSKTAIDMENREVIKLPKEVASKNAKTILEWVKGKL